MGGGVWRRFVNVMVDNYRRKSGLQTLCCIDLTRHKLFNTTTPPLPVLPDNNHKMSKKKKKKTGMLKQLHLSAPIVNFQCSAEKINWYMDCFPLGAAGRKVLCVDQSYRTLLYDTVTREAALDVPYMSYKCSRLPIFVPGADTDDGGAGHGSIYVMEARPGKERPQDAMKPSYRHQYEAFIIRRPGGGGGGWERQLLPPPPFVFDPNPFPFDPNVVNPTITSHALVHGHGGSPPEIWISVDGGAGAGTYSLDTARHTWTKVGNWTLPFEGKAEYVPELKLWFGIVSVGKEEWELGAADLDLSSAAMPMVVDMDTQPQLVGTWQELEEEHTQSWLQLRRPQFVSLGSGRFCVARFCHHATMHPLGHFFHSPPPELFDEEYFTVLTGVDVVPRQILLDHTDSSSSNGSKVQLEMIKHNSRRHMSYGSDGTIDIIF